MNIAKGHQAVMPYLMISSAAAFIEFVTAVFAADITFKQLQEDGQNIRHAEAQIGGSTIMFCDAVEQWKAQPASLFVYVDNADSAYNTALAHGGESVMEPSDQSYGRSCGVKDPCGNIWWVTSVG